MILFTGGSGLLGRELRKLYAAFYAPPKSEFDICDRPAVATLSRERFECIVHCAAYTDVAKAESEKELCYQTNVLGTRNLADTGIPMIYISTEYVFGGEKGNYGEGDCPDPKNFYALTKLLGEGEACRTTHLIIRTCFKPRPFEHAAACVDQYTSGDYVDVIAKEIFLAIRNFRDLIDETIHIGTGRKSVFDLARQTREVIPISVETIGVKLPRDTSLDTRKWEEFKSMRKGL